MLNSVPSFLQITTKPVLHFSNQENEEISKSDIPTYFVSYRIINKNKNEQAPLVYRPTYIHVKLVLYLFKVLHHKFPKIIFIIFGVVNKATHHHKRNIKQY